jgi:RimJ/RimL family protein N-acetyltransferase
MTTEEFFEGSNNLCFWILNELKEEVGFLHLFDLDDIDDGYPLFDLRIRKKYRKQGFGKITVKWLTNYLFGKHSKLERIVGATRADNFAMRKTLKACGYAKEAHYRKDWVSTNGERFDTVNYGILREDWDSGTLTPVPWNDDCILK